METTALLIIDVQKGLDDPALGRNRNNPQSESSMARLLAQWRRRQRPVIHVRHCAAWIVLLIVALLASAHATDLPSGLEAYERGDYQVALRKFRPLADQGYPEAQFHLGVMYEYGKGASWNPVEAMNWYRKAAEWGHTKAQAHLGVNYRDGHVVPKNYVKAYAWLDNAAVQGNKNAERAKDELAVLMAPHVLARAKDLARRYREVIRERILKKGKVAYERGDYASAHEVWEPLAEQGFAKAQFAVGVMYYNGEGVAKDHAQAYAWFDIVAAQGDKDAARMRDNLARSLAPEARAKAKQLARQYTDDYILPFRK